MKDARDWAFEFMTTKDFYDLVTFAREIQLDALEAASVECDHTAKNATTCGDDARILGWIEALRDDILNLLPDAEEGFVTLTVRGGLMRSVEYWTSQAVAIATSSTSLPARESRLRILIDNIQIDAVRDALNRAFALASDPDEARRIKELPVQAAAEPRTKTGSAPWLSELKAIQTAVDATEVEINSALEPRSPTPSHTPKDCPARGGDDPVVQAATALLRHFYRHAQHRCEIDQEMADTLKRLGVDWRIHPGETDGRDAATAPPAAEPK